MRKNIFKIHLLIILSFSIITNAQQFQIDNLNPRDQRSINAFENPKDSISHFEGLKVKVGGAFALQFQGVKHQSNADQSMSSTQLYDIGNNFNLPTANLDLDVALYDGINLHLRTFLSSRHHNETYVKGGYLQINTLDFIKKGFLEEFMKHATIKFGHDEINYGDAHFRRTDNAFAINNPFVGNLLMDGFATMIFAEVYYRKNGFIGMLGVTNGRLDQAANSGTSPSIYTKIGYDTQVNKDLRIRLTGSVYNASNTPILDFYDGDRAGSRYYFVMENSAATASDNFRSGQVVPDFSNKLTSFMINPFIKYKGLEFFGTLESASGKNFTEKERRNWTQFAGELLYRFGKNEQLYFGGKYNQVNGNLISGDKIKVKRFNIGAGWFMTKNILTKIEYVTQKYNGYPIMNILNGGKFDGFVIEAAISF